MTVGKSRNIVFRVLRGIAIAILLVLLLPYLITPFYRAVNPVSTLMVWRWARGAPVVRSWAPLTTIAPALPLSVIVAEDARFCTHHGIDFGELRAAIADADEFSDMRGGSTLVQQTAKNLFLWPGRSVVRKALEFPLALWIDLILGKRRVMEIYLNIAEWGPDGEFGAEAAARRAFGKSARELNGREAATLAAILPNPVRRSAGKPAAGVRRLAGIYEGRARKSPEVAACIRR
jgi:monofunctional biosynthetic peptidoglycan transglycosylase